MKKLIFMVCILISGCAIQNTRLVNSSGQVTNCNNTGIGWLGAPISMIQHSNCIDRANAAGFTEGPIPQSK